MVGLSQLAAFTVASVVLVAIPGPSVLFVIGRAMTFGRRTAFASVIGNTIGAAIAAAAVALGLGAILQASDLALVFIRFAGAAYLVWLGVQSFRYARHRDAATAEGDAGLGIKRSVGTGVIVGASNPKAYILFAAVLPQFVLPNEDWVPGQMLVLALIPLTIDLVVESAWALAAGSARAWFAKAPNRMLRFRQGGGLALIGLGVSVAVSGAHVQAGRPS